MKKKDVTNYDIRNRKKRKFIICFWFQRVEKNPHRSVPALGVYHGFVPTAPLDLFVKN
jgi:hypothetical protein